MQYDVQTPKQYLEILPKDWRREKLLAIRKMILSGHSKFTESIDYKMLSYGNEKFGILFYLNVQKNFVSLYVGNISKIDSQKKLLTQIKQTGKGCIRFTKTTPVTNERIGKFIQKAISFWLQGKDTGC